MQAFIRLTTNATERIRLTAGNDSGFLIDEQRSLWVSGDNSRGQLGLGDLQARSTFTRVEVPAVVQVSASDDYTVVVTEGGELWFAGKLGYRDLSRNFKRIQLPYAVQQASAGEQELALLSKSGVLHLFTLNHTSPFDYESCVVVELDEPLLEVSLGRGCNAAVITVSGDVWLRGRNGFGQLGLGDNQDRNNFTRVELSERVLQISAGRYHTALITEGGQLWVSGNNCYGQIGLGDNGMLNSFTRVDLPEPIRQVNTALWHTAVLTEGGQLWDCGDNTFGQLGLSTNATRAARNYNLFTRVETTEAVTELSTTWQHMLIRTSSDRIYGCGNNGLGCLGFAGDYGVSKLQPVTL